MARAATLDQHLQIATLTAPFFLLTQHLLILPSMKNFHYEQEMKYSG